MPSVNELMISMLCAFYIISVSPPLPLSLFAHPLLVCVVTQVPPFIPAHLDARHLIGSKSSPILYFLPSPPLSSFFPPSLLSFFVYFEKGSRVIVCLRMILNF